MIRIVPATVAHAEGLAGRLRAEDSAEIAALGVDEGLALVDSVRLSLSAHVAEVGGEVAAIWGVGADNLVAGIGRPWFLTTPVVERHHRAMLVLPPLWVAEWRAMFPRLENYVDARYGRAIRWLRRLGFTLHEAEPYGALGAPFRRFTMET